MSEQKKPRELFVDFNNEMYFEDRKEAYEYANAWDDDLSADDLKHYIEYSAYQAAQERVRELEAVELIYKDKQTEMNDLELELQALTVKHTALLEQVENLVEWLEMITIQNENFEEDALINSLKYANRALADYATWKKEQGYE